ncbi:hypothetical protein ACJX0J_024409, partial [Zea mays]
VADSELADVVVVSARNNYKIANMIDEAMEKVGRHGVVTLILEEEKNAENNLYVLLHLDKKINNTRDLITTLEDVIRSGYPILINTEDIEQEALATLVVNRLRGALKIATIKAPVLESRRVNILMTLLLSLEVNFIFSTVIREEVGLSFDKADNEVLGVRVDTLTSSTQSFWVELVSSSREKLNERIAKLSGGVAIKEKKLMVEDGLNATKDEGIIVGGGCTLLQLASKVGDEIVRKSLCYPFKLIAKNAGVDGRVVTEMWLCNMCLTSLELVLEQAPQSAVVQRMFLDVIITDENIFGSLILPNFQQQDCVSGAA